MYYEEGPLNQSQYLLNIAFSTSKPWETNLFQYKATHNRIISK